MNKKWYYITIVYKVADTIEREERFPVTQETENMILNQRKQEIMDKHKIKEEDLIIMWELF